MDKAKSSLVVLVTGATDGIGRETAMELARRGARVVLHGRSPSRLAEAHAALRALGGGEPLEPLRAELASLAETRAAAGELSRRGVAIDVLLNNAGVFARERAASADGFEMTFAVNHLAPFALTHALVASSAGAGLSRVVNVSSMVHGSAKLDLGDLGFERRGYDGYAAYAASKLANVLFTVELSRRLRGRGVSVNALHPGVVSTKLLTEGFQMRGGDSVASGAATSVMLCLEEIGARTTGGYFSARKPARMNPAAADESLCRRFYELSARLAGTEPLPE